MSYKGTYSYISFLDDKAYRLVVLPRGLGLGRQSDGNYQPRVAWLADSLPSIPPASCFRGMVGCDETASSSPSEEKLGELLSVRDVVELLRDFLRAKALTESEINREVGAS